MQEQLQQDMPAGPEALSSEEAARLEKLRAKRKKMENVGLVIMLVGFATLLIPNPVTGKYGEYTMFAGAALYFSGRLVK
jgi:hypothetical protein